MPQNDTINGRLISFAISNGAKEAAGTPTRLKLLNWGRNETVKGPVTVGPRTLRDLSANQQRVGFADIALDYNHQTVPGSPNYKPDPVEVAAYGVPEVVEGDGLYLSAIDWTPSGRANSSNYKDLSPTPQLDVNGEVIFLHSVALCRQGAVEGLSFYSASIDDPSSLKPHSTTPHKKTMDYRGALIELLKKLGVTLPDNPSDAEIGDAASKYSADSGTTPMSAEFKTLAADVQALKANKEDSERTSLVALATSQGKVIPLTPEQIKTTPLTVLGAIVENLKPTVPLDSTRAGGQANGTDKKDAVVTLSADQKTICEKLGISQDAYIKANPELATSRATV